MNFNEYQELCKKTAIYPNVGDNLIYPTLKLNGEAGEVAEKLGKSMRDGNFDEEAFALELGDVLWYIAMLAHEINYPLDHIAGMNIDKLESRKDRGKVSGSGDNR